eukprot:GHVU01004988.1.p1 GENE.GHVU01004988.1~~GHVU01004988.1.p1  ORF type:complete len:115 (-),score=2.85 GHVU01004988.1:572-916(-)
MLAASQPRLARGAAHTTTAAAAVRTAATAAAVLQRLHHPTEIGESDAQIGRGPNKHTVVIVLSSPLHSAIHSLTDQVWSRIPFVYLCFTLPFRPLSIHPSLIHHPLSCHACVHV